MRRRRKNKSKILVVLLVCMMFVMTAGYAAFNTDLNINVKGNKIKSMKLEDIKKLVVSTGPGLYEDSYESGSYVYRGEDPDNYILFNNELWRIVAITNNNLLKIVRNESIGTMSFDNISLNNRYNENNTYCQVLWKESYVGCNAWSKVDGIYTNGVHSGTVTVDSSLKNYLNNDYYNSLSAEARSLVIEGKFYNGGITRPSYKNMINTGRQNSWNGNIGLPSIEDYFKASTSEECTEEVNDWWASGGGKCNQENYLGNKEYWFINPDLSNGNVNTHTYRTVLNNMVSDHISGVFPVLHIKGDVLFIGDGTKDKPYQVKK